jgi:hypothetical protein
VIQICGSDQIEMLAESFWDRQRQSIVLELRKLHRRVMENVFHEVAALQSSNRVTEFGYQIS